MGIEDYGKNRITVRYSKSDVFDSSHFIHKYYLSNDDKRRLFPVDINALETMACLDDEISENFWNGVIPEDLPECTIVYDDIGLEKHVDCRQVRRGLLAVSSYRKDQRAELATEEVRAALNLNEWLREFEKILLAKQLSIEKEIKNGLRGSDTFLVDFETELTLDFYVREDDPCYKNNDADKHDWDRHSALMCRIKYLAASTLSDAINNPGYRELGDCQDHNDISGRGHNNPVYRARHCSLFHELTEHYGVPFKHLIRIGSIWANIEVNYQNAFDIDLRGERIAAKRQDTHSGKLKERSSIYRQLQYYGFGIP